MALAYNEFISGPFINIDNIANVYDGDGEVWNIGTFYEYMLKITD